MRTALCLLLLTSCAIEDDALPLPPPGSSITLAVDALIPGETSTASIGGLFVNERAYLLLSLRGPGSGPCHPNGSPCVDIRGPVTVLGQGTADMAGVVTIDVPVPQGAPAGIAVSMQALTVQNAGATSSTVSNVVNSMVDDGCSALDCSPGACGLSGGVPTCFCPPGYTATATTCEPPGASDDDGDGYCEGTVCADGSQPGDCDDADASISPSATEVCDNGIDDNCDGQQDEGEDVIGCELYFTDQDRDGFGAGPGRCYCSAQGLHTASNDADCYDSNSQARPGATQWQNTHRGDGSFDYDCDGTEASRWEQLYVCDCTVSIAGLPIVVVDFEDGWAVEPACGETDLWYNDCTQDGVVDIFGMCLPTGPEQPVTVARTQECR